MQKYISKKTDSKIFINVSQNCCKFAFCSLINMGPKGFDSVRNKYVSMPGAVRTTRKSRFTTRLNGETNYALAA